MARMIGGGERPKGPEFRHLDEPREAGCRLLTALGRDIDIVIRQRRSATGGKLRIAATDPV